MLTQEHAQTAVDYLERADEYFAAGDLLQASEKLWGAASHAVLSIATERGWRDASHRALTEAAESLAAEAGNPLIASNFSAARLYHRNFYHGFMEPEEWLTDRPKIHDFVQRVLALRGEAGANGQGVSSG